MSNREDAYRDLFLNEAYENFEALNKLLIKLEKDPANQRTIAEIFRITHTLKGNALGMGYDQIADLAHVLEDIFDAVKGNVIELYDDLINQLFRANDKLGELINAISTGEKVSYIGLKTKLEVMLRNAKQDAQPQSQVVGNEDQKEPDTIEESISEATVIEESGSISFADYIQIPVRKLDEMMNLVGELLIERDKLINRFDSLTTNRGELDALKRISSNLHFSIMNARMVQIGFLFNKFHRIARDAAFAEKKEVRLHLEGTEVEIDRNILKIISDALVHVVRNAISHGIELPTDRKLINKPVEGTVTLSASLQKDTIRITISDDGRGMSHDLIRKKIVQRKLASEDQVAKMDDQTVLDHIFMTGFSSAEKITEISGRGVGMDIVKQAVESVGGQVSLDTIAGLGTQIHLTIPSSLAIKGALLFLLDDKEYAVPMAYTVAVTSIKRSQIKRMKHQMMATFQDKVIPFASLKALLGIEDQSDLSDREDHQAIIVSYSGKHFGLFIDQLLQQKEIVEKALPKPINQVKLISGTTLLGNGKVCPVIDVSAIAEMMIRNKIGGE